MRQLKEIVPTARSYYYYDANFNLYTRNRAHMMKPRADKRFCIQHDGSKYQTCISPRQIRKLHEAKYGA